MWNSLSNTVIENKLSRKCNGAFGIYLYFINLLKNPPFGFKLKELEEFSCNQQFSLLYLGSLYFR